MQNEPIAQALLFLVGTVAGLFLLVAPVAKELSNSNQQLSFLLVFGYLTLVIAAALVFVGRRGAVCSRIEKWIYATVILLAAFFLIVRVLLALGISL